MRSILRLIYNIKNNLQKNSILGWPIQLWCCWNERLEEKQLNKIKTTYCKSNNLRKLYKKDLSEFFNSERLNKEWIKSNQIIKSLELSDKLSGINPGDQRAIYYLTKALRANFILEIGTYLGYSMINFSLALKNNFQQESNHDKLKKLITLDIIDFNDPIKKPWIKCNSLNSPKMFLNLIKCENLVEFIVSDSITYLSKCSETFDLIFLDGSHKAPIVYQEIPLALNLLKPNGVILLHDYFPNKKPLWLNDVVIPGPYLAVKRFLNENSDFYILPFGDLPWSTKLNSNTSSLAILTKKG